VCECLRPNRFPLYIGISLDMSSVLKRKRRLTETTLPYFSYNLPSPLDDVRVCEKGLRPDLGGRMLQNL